MMALSVILMCSGQTSVQHLVMLHSAEAGLLAHELAAVVGVERVHLELGEADEEAGPGVGGLVLLVVADHVADVLAHEALDALAELLAALDVDLLHPVAVVGPGAGGAKAGTCLATS